MFGLDCRRTSCDLTGPECQWWITSLTLCFRLPRGKTIKSIARSAMVGSMCRARLFVLQILS